MNFWSGLSQPCIFYSTLNANAEIWSNFAHSRLHSLCHSAAEFGTVAYVILLEGKRLQASASPAGRVWLCRENEDNKHKLCIIFPLSLFNLHSCTLLYCTVIQFWLQPQISLMSKKLLSFIFMKGPCTFLFFFFFFYLCSSFEVAGFGLEKGRGTDYDELYQWRGEKRCLSLFGQPTRDQKNDQTHFCFCFLLSLISPLSPCAFCCLRHVPFSFVIQIFWRSLATERVTQYWPSKKFAYNKVVHPFTSAPSLLFFC